MPNLTYRQHVLLELRMVRDLFRRPMAVYRRHRKKIISFGFFFAHLMGALSSVQAIMETRTSQGAIAWAVSLNAFPYGAVPAYWIFGRSKFHTEIAARREETRRTDELTKSLAERFTADGLTTAPTQAWGKVLASLNKPPFTVGNSAELLIDGKATFERLKQSIDASQKYILVMFYIIRDDELGEKFAERLIARARAGCRVYVMYDEIGSLGLSKKYIKQLEAGGVEVRPFNTTQGANNRLQLNFRNHRKIVVCDGREAFVGGLNVGDEYLEGYKALGPIRDTHVEMRGPVVQFVQQCFVQDWYWAAHEIPRGLQWQPEPSTSSTLAARAVAMGGAPSTSGTAAGHLPGDTAACIATGPTDDFESATMMFLHLINTAERRLWIATPYFVPDEQVMSALQLAAFRGVDVRVLIPDKSDNKLVNLSHYSYLEQADKAGIRILRYPNAFLHQKVLLADDDRAVVGTANFDNRSFRLNFEVSMLFHDAAFTSSVATMLQADMAKARHAPATDYTESAFLFRLLSRTARLLAPVQ